MKTFFLLCITISPGCRSTSVETSDPKIIDGQKIPMNSEGKSKFPSALGLIDGEGNLCSGSRISPDQILTAAHCKFQVGKMIYIKTSNGVNSEFTIVSRKDHPNFRNATLDQAPDLSILGVSPRKASDQETFNRFSEIARLSYNPPKIDAIVYVVGAGCEDQVPCSVRSMGKGYLKYAKSKVTSLRQSLTIDNDRYFQIDSFLMASGEEGTIHSGDSGGPVYDENGAQIGVTSHGGGLVDSSHVNLAHPDAKNFIQTHIKK